VDVGLSCAGTAEHDSVRALRMGRMFLMEENAERAKVGANLPEETGRKRLG